MNLIYYKTEKPCKKYDPCQYPEKETTVCIKCGWLKKYHKKEVK